MSETSLIYYNDQWSKVNPRVLRLEYKLTAVKTATSIIPNSASLATFDAFASQSVIDSYLGSTNEFLLAAFDATSMGNDTFGGLINMCGQARKVTQMIASCYSASNTLVTRQVQAGSALTATSLATEVAVGDQGNIGFKVDFGNTPDFDALAAGTIVISIFWVSK